LLKENFWYQFIWNDTLIRRYTLDWITTLTLTTQISELLFFNYSVQWTAFVINRYFCTWIAHAGSELFMQLLTLTWVSGIKDGSRNWNDRVESIECTRIWKRKRISRELGARMAGILRFRVKALERIQHPNNVK